MNEENQKPKSLQELTETEKQIVWFLAIFSPESISKKIVFNLLKFISPLDLESTYDHLEEKGWLKSEYRMLTCTAEVAKEVIEAESQFYDENLVNNILEELSIQLELTPFDDVMEKREYYLVARLLLTYLYTTNKVDIQDNTYFSALFANVSVQLADNAELSFYGNRRLTVSKLEERIDYQLLQNAIYVNNRTIKANAYRALGELYTKNFRYDEASLCIDEAFRTNGDTPQVCLASARMNYEYGSFGMAMMMAYRAFLTCNSKRDKYLKIEVCLFVSYICALSHSPENSRLWRKKIAGICGDNSIPDGHPLNIKMKLIDATLNIDDKISAFRILDAAELDACRFYGDNAPDMATIAYIRHNAFVYAGQVRPGQEQYSRYVEINHANYGYSEGDTAIQYSGIVYDNLARGNRNVAYAYCNKMSQLMSADKIYAATAKFENAYTAIQAYLVDSQDPAAHLFISYAEGVYSRELKPSDEEVKIIKKMFVDEKIPDEIMGLHYLRLITSTKIDLCLRENRFDDAKALIQEIEAMESDPQKRLYCKVMMGRVLVEEGKADEGLQIWKQALDDADAKHKFTFCMEVAEWAKCFGLTTESMSFYEIALKPEIMAHGKTKDIARCLNGYAEVLGSLGVEGDLEDMWNNALMLMQSMDDNDGIALLYFSLSKYKQDHEAEILIKKAIEFWKPERDLFDETLAKMYYELYFVLKDQGKYQEAEASLNEMRRYSPFGCPSGF